MSSIDTRVVEARFNNKQFAAGVTETISMLDRLKSSLKLDGANRGLQEVSAAAGKFDSSHMENSASRIGGAFTAMQATVFGAFASIGARAVAAGTQVISAFTVDPLKAGFDEYELKMGSIQTILANTAKHGTGLETVNTALEELNKYADQTIYNFGDMTKNIGLFTNAGIKVEDATTMIKGFSNSAAASGTSAEGAAGAAYQLSQALSAGKVTLMDWRSLQNVGMGNKNMQEGITQLATAMGSFEGTGTDANKVAADFNGSLEKGWLKADVMSTYLKIMSGDMDAASIAALGLTDAQVEGFQKQAQTGLEAATKVRTFTQLMSTLKEAVGSGWSESFAIIFGNFDEATELFTQLSGAIGGFIGGMSDSRNEMLKGWKDLGGRTALIDGLKEAFWALAAPLAQVGQAFRQVFPAATGESLYNATIAFRDMMAEIQPSPETLDRLQRTFAGLFSILHIGFTVIKAVATFLGKLFLGFTEGDSGILRTTASIGDFLVNLDKAISSGKGLTSFFDTLLEFLFKIINPIKDAGQAFGSMFEKLDFSGLGAGLGDFLTGILSFGDSANSAIGPWEKVTNFFDGILGFFQKAYNVLGDFFGGIADIMGNPFGEINYDDLMKGLEVGTLGAIGLFLAKVASALKNFNLFGGNGGGGLFDSLKDGLDQVTGTMKAMQNNLNATALLKLAGALGIMAVSMVILASVDPPGLIRASAAMAVMFAELAAGMKLFNLAVGFGAAAKMNLLAPALILIAVAIGILSLSVKSLAELSWEELAKGLVGVAGMMVILAAGVRLIGSDTKGMIATSVGLLLISVAIKSLVESVKDMADMDWEKMAKGLTGVGGILLALALFTRFAKAGTAGLAQGAGILLLSIAIKNLVDSVDEMSGFSWEEIAKGLVGIGGAMAIMALALSKIPATSILGAFAMVKIAEALGVVADVFIKLQQVSWEELARGILALAASFGVIVLAMQAFQKVNFIKMAGILIVALAIQILGEALEQLSSLSYEEIARGMTALAGMMIVLGTALTFMGGSLTGAAALVIVAAALNVLLPVILAFAGLSWMEIAAGLTMLAGVFVVLGVAGYLLAPVVPILAGLGIAIALLGAGLALAGAGVFLFATGLTLLAAAGAGATAAIVAIVSGLIGLLPLVAEQLGLAIAALAEGIANAGPAILDAITAILTSLLQSIITTAPLAGEAFLVLLTTILDVIVTAVPQIVEAGIQLLIGLLEGIGSNIGALVTAGAELIINFLNGIAQNLPGIITAGVNVIVAFLDGVGQNLPRIIQSGIELIINFVNGIAEGIRNNADAMSNAGINLAKAIVEGMVKGIGNGIKAVIDAAKNLAKSALNAAKEFLGIASPSKEFIKLGKFTSEGFAIGLKGNKDKIEDAVQSMTEQLHTAMENTTKDIEDQQDKLQKLTDAREEDNLAIRDAADAIDEAREKDAQAVLDAQGSLNKLTSAKKRDAEAIRKATQKLNEAQEGKNVEAAEAKLRKLTKARDADNQAIEDAKNNLVDLNKERDLATDAYKFVSENLEGEKQKLQALADEYENVTKQLDEASKTLEDAKNTRDEYNASVTAQYSKLPEVSKDTKLTTFIKDLKKQIENTRTFAVAIEELRKRGLNDTLSKDLIAKGPETLPFVKQLLAKGAAGVTELNALGAELDSVAGNFGKFTSTSLYQTGVDSAQGIVEGLKAKQTDVTNQMTVIADSMVTAIKTRLGIQSPSVEMAKLGEFTIAGFVQGFNSLDIPAFTAGFVQLFLDNLRAAITLQIVNLQAAGASIGNAIINGMVAGMNAGIPLITATAQAIAQAALASAKAALGIQSPSKEFEKIGQWSSEGMANGLKSYSTMVSSAAEGVGVDAIKAMSKTISGLGALVNSNVDVNPVIRPVLDLSSVKEDAALMSAMFNDGVLSVDKAYATARYASAGYSSNRDVVSDESAATTVSNTTFIQNNNSPKALSAATLYRQTKNQLSVAKGALASNAK